MNSILTRSIKKIKKLGLYIFILVNSNRLRIGLIIFIGWALSPLVFLIFLNHYVFPRIVLPKDVTGLLLFVNISLILVFINYLKRLIENTYLLYGYKESDKLIDLGIWSRKQEKDYLHSTYCKASRLCLSDEELFSFWNYLEEIEEEYSKRK